jgi:DNA-binding transcriptional MerR regulator
MSRRKKLPGLTMHELTTKTSTSRHAIYGWIRAGLLPKPPSSGRGVRYDDAFVARAMTIAQMRREGLYFGGIRHHLENQSPRSDETASPVAPSSERWEHLVLLPGLELSYRIDGGPVLRRLAAEIWRQFGAGLK